MLIVLSPEESAREAREQLMRANEALATAQKAVAEAMKTVDMFERNFRMGFYVQKPAPIPGEQA